MLDRAGLSVRRASRQAQLLLHCEPGDATGLGETAGLVLGNEMLRASASAGWHALHLAPDEWMLIGPVDDAAGVADRIARCGVAHSLVDIGDRAIAVELEGPAATLCLAAACPLDLGDHRFPVGACTRTLFGKVMVMLWRTADTRYRLEYARSFDQYLTALIAAAAEDATAPL